jgi:hypothetical protein
VSIHEACLHKNEDVIFSNGLSKIRRIIKERYSPKLGAFALVAQDTVRREACAAGHVLAGCFCHRLSSLASSS